MGWANCGLDSKGRPIGYGHTATCDEPGCEVEIDRGLSYACGNMHGEFDEYCEGYFCSEHLYLEFNNSPEIDENQLYQICRACLLEYEEEQTE